jgi:formiminotetrahydrofolate cyclodeaminase
VQSSPSDRFRDLTVDAFVERLASSEPVPGGGSASAVAASLGAGLVAMVAALSQDRPKYAEHADLLAWAGDRAGSDRWPADDADAASGRFAGPEAASGHRDAEGSPDPLPCGRLRGLEIPLDCVEACLAVVEVAEALAGRSNVNAASDLSVATLLAEAGARGAAANVLINLPSVGDPEFSGEMTARVYELVHDVERIAEIAREAVGSGEPRDPIPTPGQE